MHDSSHVSSARSRLTCREPRRGSPFDTHAHHTTAWLPLHHHCWASLTEPCVWGSRLGMHGWRVALHVSDDPCPRLWHGRSLTFEQVIEGDGWGTEERGGMVAARRLARKRRGETPGRSQRVRATPYETGSDSRVRHCCSSGLTG